MKTAQYHPMHWNSSKVEIDLLPSFLDVCNAMHTAQIDKTK